MTNPPQATPPRSGRRIRPALRIGLKPPPAHAVHALSLERRWRWPLVLALLLTIPSFYADLVGDLPHAVTGAGYLLAALIVAVALATTSRCAPQPMAHVRGNVFDLLLFAGLLAAALVPSSAASPASLALRLGVALLVLLRMMWALQHLVTRGSTAYLIGMAFGVLLLCGVGFWWLEPRTPTLADGLWLAFTTAATVGYGDVVPTTPASKIFAVFVVLLGFGVLTLVTAAIATAWIETEERRIEREILTDLRTQMASVHADLAALRAEIRAAARLQTEHHAQDRARRP
jgi:voltage-gated potassium channel